MKEWYQVWKSMFFSLTLMFGAINAVVSSDTTRAAWVTVMVASAIGIAIIDFAKENEKQLKRIADAAVADRPQPPTEG